MTNGKLDRAALVWGALFTATGAAFLADALGWWQVRAEILLPILLIVAGVMLLAGNLTGREASS